LSGNSPTKVDRELQHHQEIKGRDHDIQESSSTQSTGKSFIFNGTFLTMYTDGARERKAKSGRVTGGVSSKRTASLLAPRAHVNTR